MAQRTNGVYRVLTPAWAYTAFQDLLGGKRARERLVHEYLRPTPGVRILDIGCGTAQILDVLDNVQYVGYDLSPEYIEQASMRYKDRGTFCVRDVRTMYSTLIGQFDIVLAMGLLHHLDDSDALHMFSIAKEVLAERGRLITIDPAFAPGQHPLARWMISRDRGKNVRTESEMLVLANQHFSSTKAQLRHDMVRIPYTHLILECLKLS